MLIVIDSGRVFTFTGHSGFSLEACFKQRMRTRKIAPSLAVPLVPELPRAAGAGRANDRVLFLVARLFALCPRAQWGLLPPQCL